MDAFIEQHCVTLAALGAILAIIGLVFIIGGIVMPYMPEDEE